MATPKFDTTKIKPNAPQLTYATPRAIPAKFDSMTGILGLANKGIETAVTLDKSNTMNEANELANALADEYENISPTNLNSLEQDKIRIQEEIEINPSNLELETELNKITSQLANAKNQGMSNYEYERRILQKTQELSNKNPLYADEIVARVSKTLGNRGIDNLMQQDALLYKNQLTQQTRS